MSERKTIPKKIRDEVKSRFGGRCGYCGQETERLCVDHVIPIFSSHRHADKNLNDPSNLMPACFSCNNYKTSHDLESFRQELSIQVKRAREHSLNFRLAERFGLIEVTEKPIRFFFERQP